MPTVNWNSITLYVALAYSEHQARKLKICKDKNLITTLTNLKF